MLTHLPVKPRQRVSADGAAPRITHADRVIDRSTGTTKGEVAAYFEQVAELMLPHLKQRPVALLRAPRGVAQAKFFQKHVDASEMPGRLRQPAQQPRRRDASVDPCMKRRMKQRMKGRPMPTARTTMIHQPWSAHDRPPPAPPAPPPPAEPPQTPVPPPPPIDEPPPDRPLEPVREPPLDRPPVSGRARRHASAMSYIGRRIRLHGNAAASAYRDGTMRLRPAAPREDARCLP
ncbi:MAG: hypothetical protein JSR59_13945 [Proteobacteria bacterium]|nr:hypothetical protein [Pseudomonadota bacterium]